jgi:transketolase
METVFSTRSKSWGIPDEYTITGSQAEVFEHYTISENSIIQMALKILEKN